MKEDFRKSGFNAAITGAFSLDIPKRKCVKTGKHETAINWLKYLSKYWLPALTMIGFILENNLGLKASIILAIKTIIDYSWGSGTDMRAPRREDESQRK